MSTRKFSPAAKAMAFVLAVLITVTGFNTGWAQAEDNSIDVDTKVTYDDSKSTAEITFDLEKVGKQGYETQQILDADGNKVFAIEKAEKALKTAKTSNDAATVKKAEKNLTSPAATVKKNGTYKYKIKYVKTAGTTANTTAQTSEATTQSTDEETTDEDGSDSDSSDAQVYTQTVKAEVDGIAEEPGSAGEVTEKAASSEDSGAAATTSKSGKAATTKSGGVALGSTTDMSSDGTTTTYQYGNATISVNPGAAGIYASTGSFELSTLPNNYFLVHAVTSTGYSTNSINTSTQYKSIEVFSSGTVTNMTSVVRGATFYKGKGTNQTVTVKVDTSTAASMGLTYYNGHFYKVTNGYYTWSGAYANSKASRLWGNQGYLTTITSSGEENFIENLSISRGAYFSAVGSSFGPWIGYSRLNSVEGYDKDTYNSAGSRRNNWTWACGPEARYSSSYTDWGPQGNGGEPNGTDGVTNNGNSAFANSADSAMLWAWGTSSLNNSTVRWGDHNNQTRQSYVTEWSDYSGHSFGVNNYTGTDNGTVTTDPVVPTSITAKDTTVTSSKAKTLTTAKIIELMEAKATLSDGSTTKDVTATIKSEDSGKILTGTEGEYKIKFSYTSGGLTKEVTKTLTVTADPITVDSVTVSANSKVVNESYAKSNMNTDPKLISEFGAKANLSNGSQTTDGVTVSGNTTDIASGKVGTYNLTFARDGKVATAGLVIVPDDSEINGDYWVYAKKAAITTDQAKALANKEALVSTMGAKGGQGSTDRTPTVSAPDFAAIKSGQTGTYSITFSVGKAKITKDLVVADNIIIDPNTGETMTANDFEMTMAEAMGSTAEKQSTALLKSGAKAWVTDTGAEVTITGIEVSSIVAAPGTYNVIFKTARGTTLTVKATVVGNWEITADNMIVTMTKAKTMSTDDNIITAFKASAKTGDIVSTDLDVTISDSDRAAIITGTEGIYKVKFAKGTAEKEVKLTVVPDRAVIVGQEAVMASRAAITVDQAKALENKESLIKTMNARGWKDGGTAVPTVKADEFSTIKEGVAGTYEVTFTVGAASKTVKLVVADNVVKPTNEYMTANNFDLSVEEAQSGKAYLREIAMTRSGVQAWDGDTDEDVAVSADITGIEPVKGTYKVTFKTAKGTQISVNATVKDVVVVDPTNKEGIGANNFTIGKDEAADYTDGSAAARELAISQASARAWNTENYRTVPITKFDAGDLKAERGTYEVAFSTAKGTTAKVNVTVTDHHVVDPTTKESMSGNDFDVTVAETQDASTLQLLAKERSGAQAWKTETGRAVDITTVDVSKVKAAKGIYDVTFRTEEGTKLTVSCTVKDSVVIDPTKKEGISANNFAIRVSDAATFRSGSSAARAEAIERANARAWNTEDGTPITITSFNGTKLKAEKGTYEAYFSTAKGTTCTVQVEVVDNVIIDPNTKETMSANNFSLTLAEAMDTGDLAQLARTRSGAKAWKTKTGEAVAITGTDVSKIQPAGGTYEVTFSTAAGTKITVDAKVEGEWTINVGKTTLTPDQAKDIGSYADLIDAMQANAVNGSVTSKDLGVKFENDTDYGKITGGEEGVYKVTFTKDTAEKTVSLVVTDGTIDGIYSVNAKKAAITPDQAKALGTKEALIKTMSAWGTNDGTKVTPSVVAAEFDSKISKGTLGEYDITFTVGTASITKTLTVADHVVIDPTTKETMSANDFDISVAEAGTSASNIISIAKERSNVKAWNTDNGKDAAVTNTDITKIKAEKGEYDVTFSTAKGTKITVTARVKDNVIVDPINKEGMSANDPMIGMSQVEDLLAGTAAARNTAIELANARAWNTEDGSPVSISRFDPGTLKAEVGTYSMSFATAKGTTVSVSAQVYDDSTIDETNNETIAANNFDLSIKEAGGSTSSIKALARSRSNVKAVVTKTGAAVEVTDIDVSNIKAAKGSYDVTFATAKGTSVTAKATVKDETIVTPTNKEGISANNFAIKVADVATFKSGSSAARAEAITRANARAWSTDDGSAVTITKFNGTDLKAETGTYEVSFATAKGTTCTVEVEVADNVIIDPTTEETMSANNFTLTLAESMDAGNLAQLAKARSGVKAWKSRTGEAVTVTGTDVSKIQTTGGTYDVTFSTDKGTKITVKATVEGTWTINVGKTTLTTDQAKGIGSYADLIKAMDANAVNGSVTSTDLGVKFENDTDYGKITSGEEGAYKITFTKDAVEKTVYLVVTDGTVDGDYTVNAKKAAITPAQAKALANKEALVGTMSAWGTDKGSKVTPTVAASEFSKIKAGTLGEYDITFTVGTASITKTLTVADHVIIDPTTKETMTANDFDISLAEAGTSAGNIISIAKERSNVKAWNTDTGADVAIATTDISKIKAEKGEYDVTFGTAKKTEITAAAKVKDSVIVDPMNKEGMSANVPMIGKSQVASLLTGTASARNTAIELAAARAWNTEDGSPVDIITFDPGTLKAEVGTYSISFATAKGTTVSVNARVYDDSTIDDTKDETIAANNFDISVAEAGGSVSSIRELAVSRSNVKAIVTSTGAEVDVTNINVSNIKAAIGSYDVTFATAKGTSVTVKAKVKDEAGVTTTNKEGMSANDPMISKDDVGSLKTGTSTALDKAIELTDARAWNTEDGSDVPITKLDADKLTGSVGTYDMTLSTDKGSSVTVKAQVYDKTVVDPTNKETIGANNFVLSTAEAAGSVSSIRTLAKERSNVKAIVTATGETVAVTTVDVSAIQAAKGDYDVTFKTEKGTSITVKATVKDNVVVDPDGNKEGISANDFSIKPSEVAELKAGTTAARDKAIELAGASAWSTVDSSSVAITGFDGSSLSETPGTYTVTFKTAKGTKVSAKVTVTTVRYRISLDKTESILLGAWNAAKNTDTVTAKVERSEDNGATWTTDNTQTVSWHREFIGGFEELTGLDESARFVANGNQIKLTGQKSGMMNLKAYIGGAYATATAVSSNSCDIIVPGDVDRDGSADTGDARRLSNYDLTQDTGSFDIWDEYTVRLGDVDGDGYADSADGRIISQMDMGLIPSN